MRSSSSLCELVGERTATLDIESAHSSRSESYTGRLQSHHVELEDIELTNTLQPLNDELKCKES